MFQQQPLLLLSSCISIWWSTWVVRCQQDLCSSWVTEPSWYWNMMTVKASLTPANGVINNKTRWAARKEREGLSGHSTCTSQWAAGADRYRGEARYGVTLLESVIWHLLCVWICQRAGEGFWGHRCFLLSPSPWVLSKRSERRGATWRWIDVIHPAKSVLLFHVGRRKPAHLRSKTTGHNSGSSTNIIYIFHVVFILSFSQYWLQSLSPPPTLLQVVL